MKKNYDFHIEILNVVYIIYSMYSVAMYLCCMFIQQASLHHHQLSKDILTAFEMAELKGNAVALKPLMKHFHCSLVWLSCYLYLQKYSCIVMSVVRKFPRSQSWEVMHFIELCIWGVWGFFPAHVWQTKPVYWQVDELRFWSSEEEAACDFESRLLLGKEGDLWLLNVLFHQKEG